jgi:hypothetical protein
MKLISESIKVASRVCGAALLVAFVSIAFGHDDDQNRTDRPLVWVDKNGKTIGRAVGDHGVQARIRGWTLVVPVGNRAVCPTPETCTIYLDVAWGGDSQTLLFSGEKCSGDAYISAFSLVPGSSRPVVVLDNTLHIGAGRPLLPVPLKSQKSTLNGCFDFGLSIPFLATKVETTLSLTTLPFRPPFYLK